MELWTVITKSKTHFISEGDATLLSRHGGDARYVFPICNNLVLGYVGGRVDIQSYDPNEWGEPNLCSNCIHKAVNLYSV